MLKRSLTTGRSLNDQSKELKALGRSPSIEAPIWNKCSKGTTSSPNLCIAEAVNKKVSSGDATESISDVSSLGDEVQDRLSEVLKNRLNSSQGTQLYDLLQLWIVDSPNKLDVFGKIVKLACSQLESATYNRIYGKSKNPIQCLVDFLIHNHAEDEMLFQTIFNEISNPKMNVEASFRETSQTTSILQYYFLGTDDDQKFLEMIATPIHQELKKAIKKHGIIELDESKLKGKSPKEAKRIVEKSAVYIEQIASLFLDSLQENPNSFPRLLLKVVHQVHTSSLLTSNTLNFNRFCTTLCLLRYALPRLCSPAYVSQIAIVSKEYMKKYQAVHMRACLLFTKHIQNATEAIIAGEEKQNIMAPMNSYITSHNLKINQLCKTLSSVYQLNESISAHVVSPDSCTILKNILLEHWEEIEDLILPPYFSLPEIPIMFYTIPQFRRWLDNYQLELDSFIASNRITPAYILDHGKSKLAEMGMKLATALKLYKKINSVNEYATKITLAAISVKQKQSWNEEFTATYLYSQNSICAQTAFQLYINNVDATVLNDMDEQQLVKNNITTDLQEASEILKTFKK